MLWLFDEIGDRHLMCAKGAFDGFAIDKFWSGPALGRTQDNHGPAWAFSETVASRIVLNTLDLGDHGIQCGRHQLVHRSGSSPSTKYGV